MESFDAVGANFDSFFANLCPLKVGVASGLGSWIIMTSQEFASGQHYWFFAALRTPCCYIGDN